MATEPQHDQVGRILDNRYKVLSELGKGGMGTVFLGEHVVIGRQVAIKVLSAKLAKSTDFAERFRREAIAAGRLDHPNCVPVTDSGQLEDGSAFMVMELVKGQSLAKLLASEAPLDPQRALRILRHILRGLAHAHAADIVHRDIKPDNIMLVAREEDRDFARVLDFGIAKLRDEEGKSSHSLTQVGMAVGTPSYLSPEQAFGDQVDHRSDLYSCAVLLFEMLTGRAPFVAESTIGVLTKHASAAIPHLWEVAEHLQDLPMLDQLTHHGLGKARDERFQSAGEFISAIDQALLALGCELTPVPVFTQTGPIAIFPPSETLPALITPPPGMRRELTPSGMLQVSAPPVTGHEPTALGPVLVHKKRKGSWTLVALIAAMFAAGLVVAIVRGDSHSSSPMVPGLPTEVILEQGIAKLEQGKTCADRLEGVEILEKLGDKRAIPNLRKARRRMYGGVLGVGAKNANRCLTKAAQQAIDTLSK